MHRTFGLPVRVSPGSQLWYTDAYARAVDAVVASIELLASELASP